MQNISAKSQGFLVSKNSDSLLAWKEKKKKAWAQQGVNCDSL